MAYLQGILTKKKITKIQQWALSYHVHKLEETHYEDRDEFIKILTRIVAPELFVQVFGEKEESDLFSDGSGDDVVSVDDIMDDDVQAFLRSLESPQMMNAGDVEQEDDQ